MATFFISRFKFSLRKKGSAIGDTVIGTTNSSGGDWGGAGRAAQIVITLLD